MPDSAKKRLKSTNVEELLLDSDDDIYAESDVDDIDYDFCDSEISSESEKDETSQLQVERNNEVFVFASTLDETAEKGHTEKIVEKLLEGKFYAGHAVFIDNFYNSYGLAVKLLEQNTYCIGILNKKRKENPPSIITEKLKKGENISQCRNGVHVRKWKDKREINYITTEFPDKMQEVTTRCGNVAMKPAAIINYNRNMSGVDLQDQMLSYYPCERKTLRWYVKICVHTLMMSLINARVLYNKYSNKRSMTLYDFREKIIESYLPEITSDPQTTQKRRGDRDKHKLTKIEKAKLRCLSTGKTQRPERIVETVIKIKKG
ncbi:piggyBac transposable element-derived protein 4-like [Harpegnathos saltator]|uniref:piggyBac transposable element-derived protein 4-like n=1 Tax=Harpegnathos saltator TaxID=610380 RepID=UPI000DBEE928|nr:piggyBac transposable element-derived protein 4-like [Harpegnathos saltator]